MKECPWKRAGDMGMGRFREETFIRIRNDYNEHRPSGRGSFLYRYLLEGKMKEKCEGIKSQEKIDAIIHKAATDLMYNLGYPLSENIVPKDRRRTNNTVLDMIDAWYSSQGSGMAVAAGGAEEFDPEAYQQLYDFLNTAGNTSALVPVRLDPETGMGIYIVGRDHYTEFPYVNPAQACGIGLLTDWFSDYEEDPEDREDELRLCLAVGTLEEPADYPNIAEANKWYTRLYGRDEDRYGFFRECNGLPPGGLPERFKRYFETEESDCFGNITEEELEQTKRELTPGHFS